MEIIPLVVICAFSIVAGFWLLACVVGMLGILMAARAKLVPLSERQAGALLERILRDGTADTEWLSEKGFRPDGAYRFRGCAFLPEIVVWRRPEDGTYFYQHVLFDERVESTFITFFGRDTLTTTSVKHEQALPLPPGSWTQSFTARSPILLWRYHRAATAFVSEHLARRHPDANAKLEEGLPAAIRKQLAHLRTISVWPLRIPLWVLSLPGRRHDKPLWELPEVKSATGGATWTETTEAAAQALWSAEEILSAEPAGRGPH